VNSSQNANKDRLWALRGELQKLAAKYTLENAIGAGLLKQAEGLIKEAGSRLMELDSLTSKIDAELLALDGTDIEYDDIEW
jgi:hypothetical protein